LNNDMLFISEQVCDINSFEFWILALFPRTVHGSEEQ
jgi:hypothetical protein